MKKVLIIVFLIMFIITSFQIMHSFALYKNQLTGDYNTDLGVWLIKVNEQEISSGSQIVEFELPPDCIHTTSTGYVAEGKVAPGVEGYFELIIDATDTDVSVKYDLNIETLADADISILKVENYFQNEEGDTVQNTGALAESSGKYTSTISMDKIEANYLNVIKVHFRWNNNEIKNDDDSSIGSPEIEERNKLTIPLKMHFIQYTGEKI